MQEVRTKVTSRRSTFTKKLPSNGPAADDEVYTVANMTNDRCVGFQVQLSEAEIEETTWHITAMDCIVN